MHITQLPIGGQGAVQGTFTHSARVVGDAVQYVVSQKPTDPPVWGSAVLPDAGDDAPPGMETQWPVLAGYTAQGRPVLVWRAGEQGPQGWTGRSALYMGLGAATANRETGTSVTIAVSQPGTPGVQGPQGPQGDQGPAGDDGEDAEVTQEIIDRIAAATVARLFAEPPAGDHFGLPASAQSGTKFQDMQTIMLVNQGVWQAIIQAIDEAVGNLKAAGFTPTGTP